MADQFDILIQLRRDTIERWSTHKTVVPKEGEPIVFFTVRRDAQGEVLYEDLARTIPQKGKQLFTVIGNGRSTIEELQQDEVLWPVKKGAFNSIVSNRQGQGRNLNDITKINATHGYETFNDAIDELFHPYGHPEFTKFEPSSYPDLEVGQTYDQNKTYSWDAAPLKNVKPGSVMIEQVGTGAIPSLTLASGLNGQGSLPIAGKAVLRGTELDQTATIRLSGRSVREAAMTPINRVQRWKGKAAWFMHDNAEWLIANQTYKIGEMPGTYQIDDNVVIGHMQAALDGANGVLASATHTFGAKTVDGGNTGKRLYAVYPKGYYRANFTVLEPITQQPYSTIRTRELTLLRNGVQLVYVLAVLELKIVQTANVVIK
jgi:hypothetical protein